MTLGERNNAREAVQHPGKFEREHPMVPLLYGVVLEGGADETQSLREWGPSDGAGDDGYVDSYDRVGRWILNTSNSGFITGTRFGTAAKAIEEMGKIHDEIIAARLSR
jgi:hypothetical protein